MQFFHDPPPLWCRTFLGPLPFCKKRARLFARIRYDPSPHFLSDFTLIPPPFSAGRKHHPLVRTATIGLPFSSHSILTPLLLSIPVNKLALLFFFERLKSLFLFLLPCDLLHSPVIAYTEFGEIFIVAHFFSDFNRKRWAASLPGASFRDFLQAL